MRTCSFLLVRKVGAVCGRKCKGEYCSVNNKVMNGRENGPIACVGCGRGSFRDVGGRFPVHGGRPILVGGLRAKDR